MVLDFLKNIIFQDQAIPEYKSYEGPIFTAVECSDGKTGICAAMDKENDETFRENVILQALLNSQINLPENQYDDASFIDTIPLDEKDNIVMLGFIEPIFMQMNKKGIECKIFDFRKKSPVLSPMEEYEESLRSGDTFIITATSLTNGSFDTLIHTSKKDAEIFIIGPSAPMTRHLFDYTKKLKAIFGSIVINREAIGAILKGAGTRSLSPYLRKASVIR